MKISYHLARPVKLVLPICLLHFKLDAFAILFSIDILVSVMISLKRQRCQLKIRQQTAQALGFQQFIGIQPNSILAT